MPPEPLAAITLIYVFGPTFFLDDDTSGKKKGVALARLPDLRKYLISQTHRWKLDGTEVYEVDTADPNIGTDKVSPGTLEGLRKGWVTFALKEILDSLNERPIHRKVISPQPFIRALETAFQTRISHQQQDAQEFLQIVTERLRDEYHAGAKARLQAQRRGITITRGDTASGRQELAEQFGIAPPEGSEEENDGDFVEVEKEEEKEEQGYSLRPSPSTFTTFPSST